METLSLDVRRRPHGRAVHIAAMSVCFAGAPMSSVLAAGNTGWSGATVISPTGQPDPRSGSQLNDVAVNSSGLTVAAWDQYTYTTVPVDAYATRVAMSPDGSLAFVGWIDHYHGVAQVSKWNGSAWDKATTIGKYTAFSSFQEVLGLDAADNNRARAIWKSSAKSGTRIYASSFN